MRRRGYIGAWQQLRWAGQLLGPKEKTAYERGRDNLYTPASESGDIPYQWKPLPDSMQIHQGIKWTAAENDTPLGLTFFSYPFKLENGLSFLLGLTVAYFSSQQELRVTLSMIRLGGINNNTGQIQTNDISAGYWSDQHARWYFSNYFYYTPYSTHRSWIIKGIFLSEKIYTGVVQNPIPDMYQNGITLHDDFVNFAKSKNLDRVIEGVYEEIYTQYGNYTANCTGRNQLYPTTRTGGASNPYILRAFAKTASDPNLISNNLIVFS